MTRRLFHAGLLGVVLAAAAASYGVRVHVDSGADHPLECARQWLTLSRTQCRNIRTEDPTFHVEAQALSQSLTAARQTMADMMASESTAAQALSDQAQVVLEAHHALMRRTVRHLMVMREFVDIGQCARLNALCFNAMRCGSGQGMGPGMRGRGMGMGMGRGRMGMGMGRARGSLGPALTLTDAQQETIARIAPDYEADAADLATQVRAAHKALGETLQDSSSDDASVHQALEDFIAARTLLEQHTTEYVLAIRPLLTPDQQQRLIGMCRRECRMQAGRSTPLQDQP